MVSISKYYAWLAVNENTPIDIKLMVLDQCLLTALLYGAESWGDFTCIKEKIRKIETDILRRILKVKKTTSTDLIYYELNRPDIVSKLKDAQFKFFKKITNLNHEDAIVKNILDMCNRTTIYDYYVHLHGHNQTDNLHERRSTILSSNKDMIKYYRITIGTAKPILYCSMILDYYRYIITRWRLSNHKLKIETLRYGPPESKVPRHMRLCDVCNVLDDEEHAIFRCAKFQLIRMDYVDLLLKYNTIHLFLNPTVKDVRYVVTYLHKIEKLIT